MKLHAVKSSNVSKIGYSPETKTMHVEYAGGGTYAYHGVSADQHKALMAAPSIGKHLAAHIKPHHVGKKLEAK